MYRNIKLPWLALQILVLSQILVEKASDSGDAMKIIISISRGAVKLINALLKPNSLCAFLCNIYRETAVEFNQKLDTNNASIISIGYV